MEGELGGARGMQAIEAIEKGRMLMISPGHGLGAGVQELPTTFSTSSRRACRSSRPSAQPRRPDFFSERQRILHADIQGQSLWQIRRLKSV